MGNFDVTTPAGSDLLSQGDDKIREFKLAMREALRAGEVAGDDIEGVEAIFPGASPSTAPVYRYRGLKDTTAARPTAGQYGLYFDTTRNVLQRDNGTGWDDIGTMIPSGTVVVFYQSTSPVGWTKSTANNDKALRVVSGSGGGSGGTGPLSSIGTHTHTGGTHTLTVDEIPSHTHGIRFSGYGLPQQYIDGASDTPTGPTGGMAISESTGGGAGHSHGATGASSADIAYIDVIVCSKD